MVFHHHLGTIHPTAWNTIYSSRMNLSLYGISPSFWLHSTKTAWNTICSPRMNISLYGISPSSWHYSSKTACIGMMVSCQAMTWIWYFTIILAPFIQNSLGYYKLEYNANVSEAEESNRLQANFPLHSQRRESRTLFSSAIRQAIDRSLQSRNICTLSTSGDHPTACISMIVSCQAMAWIH